MSETQTAPLVTRLTVLAEALAAQPGTAFWAKGAATIRETMAEVERLRTFVEMERAAFIEGATVGGDMATMDDLSREGLAEYDAVLSVPGSAEAFADD